MNKKTIVWIATIGTMAAMVLIWASVLPSSLEVENTESVEVAEFTEEVNLTFEELQDTAEAAGDVLGQTSTNEQVNTAPNLTEEQVEMIKKQLEQTSAEETE